ncbi:MAG: 4Fe-4S dicluster domain-containing protein [Clostridia bacterium]|nr:4Fe-4S dicluster domain-containing protein [Clostridia bacterium]
MKRKIIKIDEEKCNGCGACVTACHENAIQLVNGKARLVREDYCDGLGDCLPTCPADAISFEEREAPAYDEAAVLAAKAKGTEKPENAPVFACPGTQPAKLRQKPAFAGEAGVITKSRLMQWPVQIKLAPLKAPYFDDADLLIAADCTAYAYGNFHNDFIQGRITLVGCPKLDSVDYSEKLAEILRNNNIRSILLARMEVPCCGGLEFAVKQALQASGKNIPLRVVTISTEGEIIG